MNCSRSGCGEPMAKTHISGVGYVCGECKSEFEEYLEKNLLEPKTENHILDEFKRFMDTEKNSNLDSPEMTIREFFNKGARW